MKMAVQILVSSILEILLFGLIPFFWWLIGWRKKEGFLSWLGFRRVERKKEAALYSAVIMIVFFAVGCFALYLIRDVESAVSQFEGLGFARLPAVVLYAMLNTSLPEEIFFRGFLLKRLANVFPFPTANMMQSIVFGMLHGMMFIVYVGLVRGILLVICTGGIAYAMGYVNERKANGAIYPSWMIHFASNLFSGVLSLFSVI